jgi:Ca2+-binding RTX toxin-like protein
MKNMKRRAIVLLTTMAVVMVVGSGVALAATTIQCVVGTTCLGTTAADTMSGTDLVDYMLGKGGADTMHGFGDVDTLRGDKGSDHIYGDSGADEELWGGAYVPSTNTYPDTSNDYVHGGSGNDKIVGGLAQGGVDRLYGERGNDFINASQRYQEDFKPVTKEIIDCGPGAHDEVYLDKGVDVVATNCETKHRVP